MAKSPFRRSLAHAALAAAAVVPFSAALAQASAPYPNRPIQFVVPFTPGGSNDVIARTIAPKVAEHLGQPVVVDNKPGAGGNLGAREVARNPGDGYVFLIVANNFVSNPHLYANGTAGYDAFKEFVPVAQLGTVPFLLVINPSVLASTVKELISVAREQPGKLAYASAGIGTPHHLSAELFKSMAKVDMVHVPYRGATPAVTDLVGGQVQVMFGVANSVVPHIKTGALRALAVGGDKPLGYLPGVPTVSDAGLPGFHSEVWLGMVAPAKTPQPIVDKVNDAIVRALNDPGVKERLFAQGIDPAPSSPSRLTEVMRADANRWAKVIKDTGAKAE